MYTVKRTRTVSCQTASPVEKQFTEKSVQCDKHVINSYNRESKSSHLTYDELVENYLGNNESIITWLQEMEIIARSAVCQQCQNEMTLISCNDRSDGYKWQCRKTINGKRHKVEASIRKNSWFDNSNMTLTEILKFTYWWCVGLDQTQIISQLKVSPNTGVDWAMFCREVCLTTIEMKTEKIGGEGKRVRVDESKVGKRKYHRGHYVEGQWVFGGIEQDSRKCFIETVEDRSEKTLIPLVQKWILPGTIIISDCWKGYINLDKYGYVHKTVNHSKEFVNEDGDNTNKIEGHWRQLKANLSTHGRTKNHYSTYFAMLAHHGQKYDVHYIEVEINKSKSK